MFLVLLQYEKPLNEIDRLMPKHMAYLTRCYESGVFLLSGRREPRTGGVILAVAPSRADLEAVVELDPFVAAGAASYEVVEFRSSQHHEALHAFADPGTRAMVVGEGSAP